jgi:hypothetical protein
MIMATRPTPEQSARRILAILQRHNVTSGQIMMAGALNLEFLTNGGTAAEYGDGIKFAVAQEWIEIEPTNVRLTEVGFAAI